MTRVRIKGFKIFRDRHGRMRCYHRSTGLKVDLEKAPLGSAEFLVACERITAAASAQGNRTPKAGTLGALIEHYFRTDHFTNLAPATKRDYRMCADFLAPIAATPIHILDTPLISGIHDKAARKLGWRRSNYVLTFLRQVFKYARPHGLIDHNPADGVIAKRRPRDAGYANRPWTMTEERAMLDAAAPSLRAALALMANTGLDPSDAIGLRRDAINGDTIYGLRGKTGREIAVPVGDRLRAALDKAPRHAAITVLANSHGKPWTYDGLSSAFHRLKRKLEKAETVASGLTMKGLRHTVATTLREAGKDEREIADLLGQATTSMAGHYSRSADLAAKNRTTVQALDKANEKRTEIDKPLRKSVKPRGDGQ